MVLVAIQFCCASCQSNSANIQRVSFNRTPPAVQSAFLAYFTPAATIEKIEREQQGDQDYYTFTFVDKDHKNREVELNEGGDQIQER